ncbi:putative reverse transcriptase domain-containing protein [Tanacetum coccineum]
MPPMMTTRSVGRPASASRGGGTGGRAGRGVPDFSTIVAQQLQNLLATIVAQVGDQGRGQRIGRNQNGDAVNDHIRGDVGNIIGGNDYRGCTYKEFLACNPKEYDGKGGVIVLSRGGILRCRDSQKVKYIAGSFVGMSWEDFKTLTREEFWPSNKMQKLETELWNHAMVGVGYAAYTDRFHELARLVPQLVTLEGKRTESKDRNGRDDNKRNRTGNAFATTTNPVRGGYTGTVPRDCRVVPRNVNPINARNPLARTCYECGSTDHIKATCPRNQRNQARERAFMLGAEEAGQNLNIVMGTFTLNDHYATTLFDSGSDYSFVSTTFIPLLDIEPSDLGFSYEIEIASGQLVEIDKVIKGCKLETEGHIFDINLIPFGSGSFDMIIGMDWLSNHRAEIICHKKVVRIPLLGGKVLRVIGERPEEKARQLMSAKAKEKKQEEIIVVRVFPEVFLDDLSGLPPNREIEFRIELIPGAMPVAKSPYRLAPSELEELSGQLKELQDKGFIRPSSSPWGAPTLVRLKLFGNWKAPRTPSEVCSFLGLAGSYEWVREENAFQTLKDKLCNAPVLALPDGPEDFMVYCDASRIRRIHINRYAVYDTLVNYQEKHVSANTPYPKPQYSILVNMPYPKNQYSILVNIPYLENGYGVSNGYGISKTDMAYQNQLKKIMEYFILGAHIMQPQYAILSTVFREPPYRFNYPTRRLTMEEMLAKFIDEGKREHEEMEIFIKEFRTTNELLLKTRSNLLSELTIEEKPHDDGVENKSSSIHERTTQPLVKPQQSSVPFPNRDFVNFHCGKRLFPLNWSFQKERRFFSQVKTYFWEEPYAFKLCADIIMRRYVAGSKTLEILAHCHSGPTGGHHSANVTMKKVYESGFYWPSVFKDANEFYGTVSESRVNELAELRDGAYENTRIYKERTKKWHDSRLRGDKDFKIGDQVLLYNSRLKMYPGKLKSKWSGPNIVKTVYPHGAIEITDRDGFSFKVNRQRLKKYYEGNIVKMMMRL